MRLDRYLLENGFTASRESAKRLIEEGLVTVNGAVVTKPAKEITGTPLISVVEKKYVGRGGEKLEAALSLFEIDVKNLCALDIGASTGGFTDCLLQHGAAHVVALDAGTGQLHPRLLADSRVTNIEKYNARMLCKHDVGEVDIVVMDVSFISQAYILPQIPSVLAEGGIAVTLIKPQFEAGRAALNKQGIVRAPRDRIRAITRVLDAAVLAGLSPVGLAPSPILGGDGNEEYLAYFVRSISTSTLSPVAVENTVKNKAVIRLL